MMHMIFISIIKQAYNKIILIDAYVDSVTLDLLSKHNAGVETIIYTSSRSKLSKTDIKKFNSQYGPLSIKITNVFHDRFIFVDDITAYHVGTSLKDAGKKCFAVRKMEEDDIIHLIKAKL